MQTKSFLNEFRLIVLLQSYCQQQNNKQAYFFPSQIILAKNSKTNWYNITLILKGDLQNNIIISILR